MNSFAPYVQISGEVTIVCASEIKLVALFASILYVTFASVFPNKLHAIVCEIPHKFLWLSRDRDERDSPWFYSRLIGSSLTVRLCLMSRGSVGEAGKGPKGPRAGYLNAWYMRYMLDAAHRYTDTSPPRSLRMFVYFTSRWVMRRGPGIKSASNVPASPGGHGAATVVETVRNQRDDRRAGLMVIIPL